MEVVQETSSNVIITSSEQEYKLQEIPLEQRKLHIEDQGESQQGSRVDLISQSGNSTMKRNLFWKKVEPSDCSDGAANVCTKRSPSKYDIILGVVATLAILALVLSLLALMRTADQKKALQNSEESTNLLMQSMSTHQELSSNQDQDVKSVNATLTNHISTVSKRQGPRGPAGYNGSQGFNGSQGPAGPPGPKGAGNFSQCQYKFKESSRTISGSSAKNDVTVVEPSDTKRIVGATCSTDDAKEYRLSSGILPSGRYAGKRFYKCKCAGQADIMKDGGGKMTCILHYWECPIMP